MKKKLIILGVFVLALVTLIGCTSKKVDEGSEVEASASVEEIAEKIQSDMEWPALMNIGDEEIKNLYGIDVNDLEEYTFNVPMMNVKSTELSIIKVKDIEKIDEVKESIEKRAENIQKSFETYLPDQYENAKNYLLEVKGEYIIFAIYEDTNKVQEVFNGFFK